MTDMNGKTLGDVLDGYGGSVFIPTRGVLTPDERADIVCGFLDTPFLSGTLLAADVEKAASVFYETTRLRENVVHPTWGELPDGDKERWIELVMPILAAAIPGLVVPDEMRVVSRDECYHGPDDDPDAPFYTTVDPISPGDKLYIVRAHQSKPPPSIDTSQGHVDSSDTQEASGED